ncbi:glycosyltransferase family 4 protein [Candidatus Microgenomates bacterium]|nr:glycosyltransferase family 4 protein [Candidatus Microgenomates bacterium]
MNILVFSWRDPKHPLAGGAEQVVHEHMKGWTEAGHNVTLFSSWIKGLEREDEIDGIKILRKGYQYLGVQIAAFFYYLKNKNNYDFLVDQFHGIPFFTPMYTRKPKIAIIQEAARKVWFLNPLPIPINWIVAVIGYFGEPFVFLLYRNVPFITGSNSAKSDLVKLGIPQKNIYVVNHGTIIVKPNNLVKKEKQPTIIYLGRISKDKGIEEALEAFKILKQNGITNFWVVGKPETETYGKHIDQLVKKLNLDSEVKFWYKKGVVSDRQKFELLKRSYIMINPSALEGWGLVNIEASAIGTPVVAYRSQGLIDSVKDGVSGIICSQNTPQELAKNVLDLLSDKDKLKKLSETSIKWSQNFTWDKSKKKSLSLIDNVYNSAIK